MTNETPKTNLPDGIYFDLSFADYLAQERLSGSGLTKLIEGPSVFWADSWMNPDREPEEETPSMALGSAYHAARFEPAEFPERYACLPNPDDFENLLTSDAAVCAKLKELEETQKKAGETQNQRALRLEYLKPEISIWSIIMEEWEEDNEGKKPLKPRDWRRIETDARNLRANPEIADLVSGGYAEVSILYTCPSTGLPIKIRPDYLTPERVVHFKTWEPRFSGGKPGNISIRDNFQFNGHYRTNLLYLEGLEETRLGNVPLANYGGSEKKTLVAQQVFLKALRHRKGPLDSWYLFQRRGGVPDIRARKIRVFDLPPGVKAQSIGAEESEKNFRKTASAVARKASLEIAACKKLYMDALDIYGVEPWFPRDMIGELSDDDFSPYWLDSIQEPR